MTKEEWWQVGTLHPTPGAEAWTGFFPSTAPGGGIGNHTPTEGMCMEWRAWNSMLAAAPVVAAANDLTPAAQRFGRYPKTFT